MFDMLMFFGKMFLFGLVFIVAIFAMVHAVKWFTYRLATRWAERYIAKHAGVGEKIIINSYAVERFAGSIAVVFYAVIGSCLAGLSLFAAYKTREVGLHPDMKVAWLIFVVPVSFFLIFGGLFLHSAIRTFRESLLAINLHLRQLENRK